MNDIQLLKFPGFTLHTPSNWIRNIDPKNQYSYSIKIDTNDSFQVDIGQSSKPSSSLKAIAVQNIHIQQMIDEENEGEIIGETETVKTTVFQSDTYTDMIAGRQVTCRIPQTPGKGISAVFFEKFITFNESDIAISFIAFNLKPDNETKFFAVVKTLIFDTNGTN